MSWLTDNQIFLSIASAKILALTAYGEARGEGAEGMMAVLNVINNRAQDRSFFDMNIYNATGSPYHAVALKQKQFSVFNFGDPNRPMLVSMASNFDKAVSTNSQLNQAYQMAFMLLNRTLTDNTSGAVYYHEKSITPSWSSSFINLGQIGNHIFYATTASLQRFKEAVTSVTSAVSSAISEIPASNWFLIAIVGIGGILLMNALSKTGRERR